VIDIEAARRVFEWDVVVVLWFCASWEIPQRGFQAGSIRPHLAMSGAASGESKWKGSSPAPLPKPVLAHAVGVEGLTVAHRVLIEEDLDPSLEYWVPLSWAALPLLAMSDLLAWLATLGRARSRPTMVLMPAMQVLVGIGCVIAPCSLSDLQQRAYSDQPSVVVDAAGSTACIAEPIPTQPGEARLPRPCRRRRVVPWEVGFHPQVTP
jgi:hypothetical protein